MSRLHPFAVSRPGRGPISPLPPIVGRAPTPIAPVGEPTLLDVLPVAIAQAFAMALAESFPTTFPPFTSRPFTLVSSLQTVSANASVDPFLDLTGFLGTGTGQIPLGQRGVITAFGVNSASTSLKWTFEVNQAPRQPIIGFVGQYGTIAAPSFLPGPGFLLRAGDLFSLKATNTSGVDITLVAARIDGFLWEPQA